MSERDAVAADLLRIADLIGVEPLAPAPRELVGKLLAMAYDEGYRTGRDDRAREDWEQLVQQREETRDRRIHERLFSVFIVAAIAAAVVIAVFLP